MQPETRYVKSGGANLAYQVIGDGPADIVFCAEFWHSIEAQWLEPRFEAFLRRLASFARLICYDQRGTGLSDMVTDDSMASIDQWMDDVAAVMNAAGSPRATVLGSGGGGFVATMFAATHPGRTASLVLLNAAARVTRTDDYPWGTTPEYERDFLARMESGWGRGIFADLVAPSEAGDPAFREWWARYERLGARAGVLTTMRGMLQDMDVRDILPAIRVPALVIHRAGNRLYDAGMGRDLADRIPNCRYVEVAGDAHLPFVGNAEAILGEIEEFITGERRGAEPDRVLATVLFTDIVDSTRTAAHLGDRGWRELLERHGQAVRRELARFRGREVDAAGDGFLALFDGPGRAVQAAEAIRDAVAGLDLVLRIGVHTGEVEQTGTGPRGIAVHIGARVAAEAAPGEVLVSSTVRDLVAGSGIEFEDRGTRALKGVPGEWRVFAVAPRRAGEPRPA